jgi:stalled ribosome rescue protein Dom34
MHNKEKEEQSRYHKKIMDVVKRYNKVILFGPTNAKEELFNVLMADNRFEDINIQVKQTDKMSPQQQHAFVMEFFANSQSTIKPTMI